MMSFLGWPTSRRPGLVGTSNELLSSVIQTPAALKKERSMSKIISANFGNKNSISSNERRFAQTFSSKHCISNPEGGWEPVGFDENGCYVVLSRKTGQLKTFRPNSLDGNTLRMVVGTQYCAQHYGEYDSKL